MKIKWQKENQFTSWGLFQVGEVYDTEALGIPKEIVKAWIKDGWAIEAETKRRDKNEH